MRSLYVPTHSVPWPYLASPPLTSPFITSPRLNLPHLICAHIQLPQTPSCLASPHITVPPDRPDLTFTSLPLALPFLLSPHLTSPPLNSIHPRSVCANIHREVTYTCHAFVMFL